MGFRFRKSIKIAPGLRLNISKRGASLSIGRRGVTTNISKRGVRQTLGIPGTGISYSRMLGKRKRADAQSGSSQAGVPIEGGNRGAKRKLGLGCGGIFALVVLLAVCSNLVGGNRAGTVVSPTTVASRGRATPAGAVLAATPSETVTSSPTPVPASPQVSVPVAEEPAPSASDPASSGPVTEMAQTVALTLTESDRGSQPVGSTCPADFPVKGNINRTGEHIYHVPGDSSYSRTKPEQCFASASVAVTAGYRAPIK